MLFQLPRKSGFGVLMKGQGIRGFFRGWMSTLLGYSAQGACNFGFYDSAFAQLIADVAVFPFKVVKVHVQHPGFAHGFSRWFPKLVKSEGVADTMMKFSSIETIMEFMYKYAIPTPKDQYVVGTFRVIVSHPEDNLHNLVLTRCEEVWTMGSIYAWSSSLYSHVGTLTGAQCGVYDAFKVPTSGGSAHAAQITK
ncbi:Mitochondrial phosphate carrier protein 3 mitochondrial [Bienertia sinuspersici]